MKSKGLKRKIASILAMLTALAMSYPFFGFLVPWFANIAAFFGVVGVGHAAVEGTVTTYKVGSIAALLAAVIAAMLQIPELAPYVPLVALIASFFGVANLAISVKEST